MEEAKKTQFFSGEGKCQGKKHQKGKTLFIPEYSKLKSPPVNKGIKKAMNRAQSFD